MGIAPLTIGMEEGVITSRPFTMLFLMAVATTVMAVPLLKRFVPVRADFGNCVPLASS
jgi:hypothetical protein